MLPFTRLFFKTSVPSCKAFSTKPLSSNLLKGNKTDFFISKKKSDVRFFFTRNDFDDENQAGERFEINLYSAKNITTRFIGIQYDPTLIKVMKPTEREAAAKTISLRKLVRLNPIKTTIKTEEPLDLDREITPNQEKQRQLRIEPLLDQMKIIIPKRNITSSEESGASILAVKRTWQPKKGKRRKKHGFLVRLRTNSGRKVLQRRKLKKRRFMSV